MNLATLALKGGLSFFAMRGFFFCHVIDEAKFFRKRMITIDQSENVNKFQYEWSAYNSSIENYFEEFTEFNSTDLLDENYNLTLRKIIKRLNISSKINSRESKMPINS
ncbi:MAG: hypothetical protein AB8G05_19090 [Oligoflexales bacterium]